jgi:hypothetical protein
MCKPNDEQFLRLPRAPLQEVGKIKIRSLPDSFFGLGFECMTKSNVARLVAHFLLPFFTGRFAVFEVDGRGPGFIGS